jgi:hypothetical protein
VNKDLNPLPELNVRQVSDVVAGTSAAPHLEFSEDWLQLTITQPRYRLLQTPAGPLPCWGLVFIHKNYSAEQNNQQRRDVPHPPFPTKTATIEINFLPDFCIQHFTDN